MSFVAGRLASTEGAYFLQESRFAVDRLIQKKKKNTPNPPPPNPRGQLPEREPDLASSVNDQLPTQKYASVDPEKLKAAAAKISKIAIASAVLIDVTTLTFGLSVSNLELQNGDDRNKDEIRNKARDLFHPKLEGIEEQLAPLRVWAQSTSKEWRLKREEAVKESRLVKEIQEFAKRSNVKTSN